MTKSIHQQLTEWLFIILQHLTNISRVLKTEEIRLNDICFQTLNCRGSNDERKTKRTIWPLDLDLSQTILTVTFRVLSLEIQFEWSFACCMSGYKHRTTS